MKNDYRDQPYRPTVVVEKTYIRQPFPTRLIHWTFFLTMTAIATSGFYMHAPWFPLFFGRYLLARYTHSIAAFVLTGLFCVWAYFTIALGAAKKLLFNRLDFRHLPQMIRYLLFLDHQKPPYLKYNPLQKSEFAAWIAMFLIQAFTGFILYRPSKMIWGTVLFWDLAYVRLIHFLVAVLWTASIAIHVYFAVTSDFGKLAAMVIGIHKKKQPADDRKSPS